MAKRLPSITTIRLDAPAHVARQASAGRRPTLLSTVGVTAWSAVLLSGVGAVAPRLAAGFLGVAVLGLAWWTHPALWRISP
jgi:hypothetical protein